jgi:hypothetical protein
MQALGDKPDENELAEIESYIRTIKGSKVVAAMITILFILLHSL